MTLYQQTQTVSIESMDTILSTQEHSVVLRARIQRGKHCHRAFHVQTPRHIESPWVGDFHSHSLPTDRSLPSGKEAAGLNRSHGGQVELGVEAGFGAGAKSTSVPDLAGERRRPESRDLGEGRVSCWWLLGDAGGPSRGQ